MTTEPKPLRILIVDDHPIVRQGMADLVSRESDLILVGAVESGQAAIAAVNADPPDLVLLDLRLGGMDGLTVLSTLRRQHPGLRVVILSAHDGDTVIAGALKAGAAGYLLKTMNNAQILEGIRDAARGRFAPAGPVAERLARFALTDPLTKREVDVLRLAAQGHSNRHIANELGLSEHTVKSYVRNVLAKLDVADRTEAVAAGIRRGIIALERE